jgi:hypothetical protein
MRLVLYTCLPLALLAVRALPSLVHPSSMLCALFSPMCAPSMPCAPSPHSCISFLCRACHSHTRTRLFFAVRAFLAPLCTLFFCAWAPRLPVAVRTLPVAVRALNRPFVTFVYQRPCTLLAASKTEYVREMGPFCLHFICGFVSWVSFVGSLYETIGILKHFRFFSF